MQTASSFNAAAASLQVDNVASLSRQICPRCFCSRWCFQPRLLRLFAGVQKAFSSEGFEKQCNRCEFKWVQGLAYRWLGAEPDTAFNSSELAIFLSLIAASLLIIAVFVAALSLRFFTHLKDSTRIKKHNQVVFLPFILSFNVQHFLFAS